MTGYGRGSAELDGARAIAEIRSVNHRFLDVKLRGSSLGVELEDQLRSKIRGVLARGSVTLMVRFEAAPSERNVRVDVAAARRAYRSLRDLADDLGVERPTDLALVCSVPGVIQVDDGEPSATAVNAALAALDEALAALAKMREHEGAALERDLSGRLDRLLGLVDELQGIASVVPADAQKRLSERIDRLLKGSKVDVDPARLAQEVAVLVDRLDVTEELVRVRAHVDQLRALMVAADKPVGRRLDFLVQELGREFNTVASKSQSAQISRLAIEGKAEVEKVREQVQNIE